MAKRPKYYYIITLSVCNTIRTESQINENNTLWHQSWKNDFILILPNAWIAERYNLTRVLWPNFLKYEVDVSIQVIIELFNYMYNLY